MNRATVLIVEDDSTLLRGLSDNFQDAGFEIKTAEDGQQAVRAAMLFRPDLVILDIMLPKMNGFQVCQELRAAGLVSTIIMLTAKGQEDDIVRGLELGADDYVTKPFSIRELLARSRAFLRRQVSEPQEFYEFGDFRLDLTSHRLTRAGSDVALTTKEFRLLQFLVQRAGKALTRNEILDQVWGRDVIVGGRSVDRCMTTLRSKLNPDMIRTIRDVGYRFEATVK